MEDIIISGAKSRGEVPRYVTPVYDLIAKDDKYLLISNFRLTYINKKDNLPIVSYSWFKSSKMQVTEDTIDLLFGTFRVYFETEKVTQIQTILLDIIPRILRPTELISFGYFESPDERPPPTPNSALLRLTEKAKLNNTQISKNTLDRITEILTYSTEHVDFSKFENQIEGMQLLFDILPLCSSVTSIKTYSTDKIDVFDLLSTLVCESCYLENIEIEGPITKHYDSFLRHLSRNKEIPLQGLSFTNANLNETNLRSLAKCLSDKYICSIAFRNAFLENIYPSFYNNFLPTIGKQLTVLNLDGMKNIDLNSIIKHLSFIEAISISDCSLDIIDILKSFSNSKLEYLKLINMSKNRCSYTATSLPSLPATVNSVQLSNVSWEENSLVSFFSSISSIFLSSIRLDVSCSQASNSEWQRLLNLLRNLEIKRLQCLIWDENPISSRFFTFLTKNPQIDYLSLSGCFSESDGDLMKHLEKFIPFSSLKSLVIQGKSDKFMGANICSLLRCLSTSKTVEYVDLSNSKCRDRGIIEASNLFNCETPIAFLNIDGACPRSPKSLFDFCWKAAGNKRAMAVSFPSKDLRSLHLNGQISDVELSKVTNLFKLPQPTFNEEMSPFESPFEIYREERKPMFPMYLKPIQPSPEGFRTVDMANTSEGDQTRTELTIEFGEDEIRLVPVEDEEKKNKKLIKKKSAENLMTLESAEMKSEDNNPQPTNTAQPQKKRRRKVVKKKTSLPKPPSVSETSGNQSQKSGSQKKKRKVTNSSISSSAANEISSSVKSSEGPSIKRTKKIRKISKNSSAKTENDKWKFPITNSFDDVFKNIFVDAEKNNQIDDLLEQIHKL